MLRFLFQTPRPPTALFCWHDRLGYRMLEACKRARIAVPDQLSLVGYDGLQFPPLSPHVLASIRVDIDVMAQRTVQLLDTLIRGHAAQTAVPLKTVFPTLLSLGTTLTPAQ